MIKQWSLYFFCCIVILCRAQREAGFGWPIDMPHTLTGNYGELRPNHFHAGLDFSTRGKINLPVYAVADGYVSRIRVSSGGYGKAIYITHANGKLSLYAHLTSYAGDIAGAVKNEQYGKQSYEVEFFPGKDELKVKRGQLIGYSGNTGSSTGPHLHFEIRDVKTEVPLNPLGFYSIEDTIRPVISHISFFNLADTSKPAFLKSVATVRSKRDSLFLKTDSIVLRQSILGFAFAGYDQFVYNGNQNVAYFARLFLDGELIYGHQFGGISFSDHRFVNEFAETVNGVKYQKCFLPTLYPPGIYKSTVNKGRIVLRDTNFHLLQLFLADEKGNERQLRFYVKTKTLNNYAPLAQKGDLAVFCHSDLQAVKNGLRIYFPKGAVYNASPLFLQNALDKASSFTILPELNLAVPVSIGFRLPSRYSGRASQLVVKNRSSVYVPVVRNDSVFCSVYNLGKFELETDTVAPKIKTQLSPQQISRLRQAKSFSFVLRDQLSGIGKYKMYINGTWVLAEYDAKNNLLTYFPDKLTPAGTLVFRIEAEDRVGNKTSWQYTWKR